MTAPFKTWTVLPHGELTQVDDGVLTVIGDIHMPLGELPRRMTVVRLRDGGLVIYSAIALDEAGMTRLEAMGPLAWLVVPNDIHRQDARIWKDRYPGIKVVTPPGAWHKVQEVVQVDTTTADFADPDVSLIEVAGTQGHEVALKIVRPGGVTLVLNDIVGNIRDPKGIAGWLLKLMKFAGDEPQIPAPVRAKLIENKAALRDQLLDWSSIPDLRRILVAHGDIIETDPPEALRRLAAQLD